MMSRVSIFVVSLLVGVGLATCFFILKVNRNLLRSVHSPLAYSQFSMRFAPLESIRGTIVSLNGTVDWQSRIATEPAQITAMQDIQQGENIITKQDGNVIIQFPQIGSVTLSPQSELDVIQTLPDSFVFAQKQGITQFMIKGTSTVSVRSLHMLVEMQAGDIGIRMDSLRPDVTVEVYAGTAKVAFNDLSFVSQVLSIPQRTMLVFHDDTRTVEQVPF